MGLTVEQIEQSRKFHGCARPESCSSCARMFLGAAPLDSVDAARDHAANWYDANGEPRKDLCMFCRAKVDPADGGICERCGADLEAALAADPTAYEKRMFNEDLRRFGPEIAAKNAASREAYKHRKKAQRAPGETT